MKNVKRGKFLGKRHYHTIYEGKDSNGNVTGVNYHDRIVRNWGGIRLCREFWNLYGDGYDETLMMVYRNDKGDYIGDFGKLLLKKGILVVEKANPKHSVCSIGFCEKEQKWYGWSHRAMYGFGIGSSVKFGDCAFVPDNIDTYKRRLCNFYRSDAKSVDVEVIDPTLFAYTKSKHIYNGAVDIDMEDFNKWKVSNTDKLPVAAVKITFTYLPNYMGNINSSSSFDAMYSWGKGEWTAKTLEDAKQMAKDFAESVS